MAIIRLQSENFQNYELVANPKKTFESSSHGATYEARITGSIALFADASPRMKDLEPSFGVAEEGFDDINIELARINAFATGSSEALEHYLTSVNDHPQGARQNKRQEVLRFTPGVKPDKNFMSKGVIKNTLFKHYANEFQSLDWGYTNYNCFHFFKADGLPEDTALIYPCATGSAVGNYYAPSGSFTFDFYIKPKVNKNENHTGSFRAGTILHMSSCYAISLVSGTSRGSDGLADKFRILFQLSQSADIPPSLCVLGEKEATAPVGDPYVKDWLFVSADNSLTRDSWHHVTIRWPGNTVNGGTGSIDIDNKTSRTFIVPSSSCMQAVHPDSLASDDPNALFMGNYYTGQNTGFSAIARYFASTKAAELGLTPFAGSGDADPTGVTLNHLLSAELHDIKIYQTYKSDIDMIALSKNGPSEISNDLLFYVPPFFTQEVRSRDILQTPFFDSSGSSEDPFNVALSFGVGGLEINLENFCRELVKGEFPRLLNLTSSRIDTQAQEEGMTSDNWLYKSGSAVRRLYSLLPCDNGKFVPSFALLTTASVAEAKFVDRFKVLKHDLISLEDMVSTASLPVGLMSTQLVPTRSITGAVTIPEAIEGDVTEVTYGTGSFLFDDMGASPEDPSVTPGNILTVLQRTGDPSSNQIVMFDASNMFYGDKIMPGSLVLTDLSPTGSRDAFTITLRDNGLGNIYRADTPVSASATWNSVGNILYEEGLMVIKSPHLSLFGTDRWKIQFEGQRTVYVFEISVPVVENLHNSSSNPKYKDLRPSSLSNELSDKFTYITGIQLHDDNFNIIGRATLAQPFVKRESDRVVIKLRMDY